MSLEVEVDLVKSLSEVMVECRRSRRIRDLRRWFLLALRAHFAHPANQEDGAMSKCYIYDPDASRKDARGLAIDLMHTYDPEHRDRSPALYVGLRGNRYEKGGMSSASKGSPDNSRRSYTWGTEAVLSIMAEADDGNVAADLCEEAFEFMLSLCTPEFQGQLGLAGLNPESMSDVKREGKPEDRSFTCTAIFRLKFSTTTRIAIESHRLKKVALELAGEWPE